ncbi:hypothetical protein [Streptomyces sp. NPDC046942]|uniref:hypothetical protein n=1 Tax=Streptomyces sp. NPDC046942 TaxID=3155137 RepID=UPI0033FEF47E
MVWSVAADDVRVVAVRQTLAPYAWRSLRLDALCRRAVAAMDGVDVNRTRFPDAEEQTAALIACLAGSRWRSHTVEALSRRLVSAADAWRQEQAWLDIQLGLLLDDAD